MNLSHLLETLNTAQTVRQSNYKHFRAFIQSGVLRFNSELKKSVSLVKLVWTMV